MKKKKFVSFKVINLINYPRRFIFLFYSILLYVLFFVVSALFSAVEHGHVEKARTILESTDVDVNSVNSDNLTPLDVAVLTNHRSLAKMLVAFGAQEGSHCK